MFLNSQWARAQADLIIARSPGGFWGTVASFVGTNGPASFTSPITAVPARFFRLESGN